MLANTSLCAEPSEMMVAVAAAVASPAGVRSKVKVLEVVNCPVGDTVTVPKQTCLNRRFTCFQHSSVVVKTA